MGVRHLVRAPSVLLALLALFVLLAGARVEAAAGVPAPSTLLAVDELVFDEGKDTLRGVGWLAQADSQRPVAVVQVIGSTLDLRVPIERVRRPDVARVLDRPEALDSGWRFEVHLPGAVREGEPLSLRFIDAGGAVIAEVSDKRVVMVALDRGVLRHWAFALVVMGLFGIGLLVRRFAAGRCPGGDEPPTARHSAAALAAGAVLACAVVLSSIVPPFQSPDEFDHVERAYALSDGQWRLEAPQGRFSGVRVDTGLLEYMAVFEDLPFHPEARLDRERFAESSGIAFSGVQIFSVAPGTGFYLPLIYLPQASAIWLGRSAGASVEATYRLARLLAGLVAALMVFEALRRWRPSALSMVMLLAPMSVFQWAGAGIDALSIGASMLAMALWLESVDSKRAPGVGRIVAVSVLVIAVVGSRIQLAPLLLVPLAMMRPWTVRRAALGLLPGLVITAWVVFALASTRFPQLAGMSAVDKLLAYASEPSRLVEVLWTTASTPSVIEFYWRSFVGVLGWLDTPLDDAVYVTWALLMAMALAWTLAIADWSRFAWPNLLMLVMGCASAALVPLLLLLMWTPFDAAVVDGVQGRYFLLPMLLLSMALPGGRRGQGQRVEQCTTGIFTAVVAVYSLAVALPALVYRYYG